MVAIPYARLGTQDCGIVRIVGPSPCGYLCEEDDVYKSIEEAAWYSVAENGVVNKWKSLVPGLRFVSGYKILQWVYKFDGQLYVKNWMRETKAKLGCYL